MKASLNVVRTALLVALVALLCLSTVAYAEPLVIDYAKGELTIGENVLVLAPDVEAPVAFEVAEDGAVTMVIQATIGEMRVQLETAEIALTEAAKEYFEALEFEFPEELTVTDAKVEPEAEPAPAPAVSEARCDACGGVLSSGNHSKLDCGHYACKVSASHPTTCEYCGKYKCNGLDHATVCTICGKHVCTSAHRNDCRQSTVTKLEDGTIVVNPQGYNIADLYQYGEIPFYGTGDAATLKIKEELYNVHKRLNTLLAKEADVGLTEEEKAEVKRLWEQSEALQKQL